MYLSIKYNIFTNESLFENPLYDRNSKLQFQIQDVNEVSNGDGVSGKLSFTMPGKDREVIFIRGKLGVLLARKICHSLGYSQGKFITGLNSKAEESQTFSLKSTKGDKNLCTKIFSEIVAGQDFSPEKLSKIKNQCISRTSKNHVQIECTKQFKGSTSFAAQNACGDGQFCPSGSDWATNLKCARCGPKNCPESYSYNFS